VKEFEINDIKIGLNCPIFLIAEVGINHNGQLAIAKKLIDKASEAKVDAIKFQTYKTEKLILKSTPKAKYQKTKNDNEESQYQMLKKYELTKEDFKTIKEYCDKKKILFLSTPFDESSVDLLEELGILAYKVGSGDMNNFPLIKLICTKNKPILLSTGMANLNEVKDSVKFIKENGITKLVIFQCTTRYPAKSEELNLNVIDTYKKEFSDNIIGFSDHSEGIEASIAAAAKGVKVIEKHFTLSKNMVGPDHKASLNTEDLIEWVEKIRDIELALGTFDKFPSKSEIEIAKIARKSVVSLKLIKKGVILKEEDISVKRPAGGISPIEFDKLIGKKVNKDIPKDSIIYWEDVE